MTNWSVRIRVNVRQLDRWTVAFFFNLVDIAAYKLQRIGVVDYDESKLASGQVTRQGRLFLSELGMSLTNDHASERFTYHIVKRRRNQALVVVAAFRSTITDSPTSSKSSGDGRRRRCNACPERKTTRSYHTCGVSVCKQHSTVLMTCLECAEGLDHGVLYNYIGVHGWTVDRLISSRIR